MPCKQDKAYPGQRQSLSRPRPAPSAAQPRKHTRLTPAHSQHWPAISSVAVGPPGEGGRTSISIEEPRPTPRTGAARRARACFYTAFSIGTVRPGAPSLKPSGQHLRSVLSRVRAWTKADSLQLLWSGVPPRHLCEQRYRAGTMGLPRHPQNRNRPCATTLSPGCR